MGFISKLFDAGEKVLDVVNRERLLLECIQFLKDEFYNGVRVVDQPTFLGKFSSISADDARLDCGAMPLKKLTLCMPKVFQDKKLRKSTDAFGHPIILIVTFYDGAAGDPHNKIFNEMFPNEDWAISSYLGSSLNLGDIKNWFQKTALLDFGLTVKILEKMGDDLDQRDLTRTEGSYSFSERKAERHDKKEHGNRQYPGLRAALSFQQAIVERAESGDASAQYTLALMYCNGHGFGMLQGTIQEDRELAIKWSLRSAEQGDADAQFLVGSLFGLRSPTKFHSVEKQLFWLEKAAGSGVVGAMCRVGGLYAEKITESPEKFAIALKFLRAYFATVNANGSGDLTWMLGGAHYSMGLLFQNGPSAQRDLKQAIFCMERAAELDLQASYSRLAQLYGDGKLGPIDVVQSYKWALICEVRLCPGASKILENIEPRLSVEQKSRAKAQADDWMSRNKFRLL